jgi:hypothetical protein
MPQLGAVARLGEPCSEHRQQLLHLRGVDPGGRVAVALVEGVTTHPEGGVTPQRPVGGAALEQWRPCSAKRHTRQAVSTVSSA